MWGKEVQAETEVGGRENGEGFHEDVGCGFVAGKRGVELVSVCWDMRQSQQSLVGMFGEEAVLVGRGEGGCCQIELIDWSSGVVRLIQGRGLHGQVIGNVILIIIASSPSITRPLKVKKWSLTHSLSSARLA